MLYRAVQQSEKAGAEPYVDILKKGFLKRIFLDNKNKYFLGWPIQYFGLKGTTGNLLATGQCGGVAGLRRVDISAVFKIK